MKHVASFFCICALALVFNACQKLTPEAAKEAVMRAETDRLPLLIQQMDNVESIVIDSMRIRITDEPMDGYLYTTWTYELENKNGLPSKEITKSFIVLVSNIQTSPKNRKYVEWMAGWDDVYKIIKDEMFEYEIEFNRRSLFDFDLLRP